MSCEVIYCQRGFHSVDEIMNGIDGPSPSENNPVTSGVESCNGCPNFTYSGGLGGCKYVLSGSSWE